MKEARAYEELRTGFTAAVSHELRTPLARLLALLESASLPDADKAAQRSFKGTVFRGHLERGGTRIEGLTDIKINIKK